MYSFNKFPSLVRAVFLPHLLDELEFLVLSGISLVLCMQYFIPGNNELLDILT